MSSSNAVARIAGSCLLAACLTTSGCMIVKVDELRQAPTRMASNESVVVLAKPHVDGTGTENSFVSCVQKKLLSPKPPADTQPAPSTQPEARILPAAAFQIIPQQRFVDAMYPWLEYSTTPQDASRMGKFLERPGVREKVSALGVRYVVWLDGATRKTDGGGGMSCILSTGGAGCFGVGWWTKQAFYEAQIWDLQAGVGAGTINTSVAGTSVMIGVVVPIPLIARVQGTACDRLGNQLKAFLMGMEY